MTAALKLAQPKFTNAAKLLIDEDCEERLQFVRVTHVTKNGITAKVANITNKKVLLRRYADLPDGVYDINPDGSLSEAIYPIGMEYPDLELLRPPFEKIKATCEISREHVGKMIMLCDEIFKIRGYLQIDKQGMWCTQNTHYSLQYPFNLEFPILLNPRYLSIALTEMLQYPSVKFLREIPHEAHKTKSVETPLVIGVNWGSCALIMPTRGGYY